MIKYNPANSTTSNRLEICVRLQQLILFIDNQPVKTYAVSTAQKGIGNQIGSNSTPIGYHLIVQLFGQYQPCGMIFKNRKPTGKIAEIYSDQTKRTADFITTRIIRLKGLEPEINGNSFRRYIYIHGTPEEGLLGKPVSHGCIRMRNQDIIELYDLINLGMVVKILE